MSSLFLTETVHYAVNKIDKNGAIKTHDMPRLPINFVFQSPNCVVIFFY